MKRRPFTVCCRSKASRSSQFASRFAAPSDFVSRNSPFVRMLTRLRKKYLVLAASDMDAKHARRCIDLICVKAKENHRWVKNVKTVSIHPPEGLFTKDAETIAKSLASKKVSPKRPASGMKMLNYFINRAGKGLSEERQAELEKVKGLLSEKIRAARKKGIHSA